MNQLDEQYQHTLEIIEKMERENFIVSAKRVRQDGKCFYYSWRCKLAGDKTITVTGPTKPEPYPAFAPCVIAFRSFKAMRKAESVEELAELIRKIKLQS